MITMTTNLLGTSSLTGKYWTRRNILSNPKNEGTHLILTSVNKRICFPNGYGTFSEFRKDGCERSDISVHEVYFL